VEAPELYEHGEKVRRPRSQLSVSGRTPRYPEDKGEVTDNLAPIWLDTLSNDLLTGEAHGEADLLAADYYDLLVVEQLLSDDGG
jgi:hypothetical protein